MKPRQAILATAALIVAGGLAFVLWPKNAHRPLFRLAIVRRAEEQGKPVVFFRIVAADRRRFQITGVQRVYADRKDDPSQFPEGTYGFWAPSQAWPIGDPRKAQKEFGVLAPTNAPVWRLRVTLWMESPSAADRLNSMRILYRMLRKRSIPIYNAAKTSWEGFYSIGSEAVESDFITNSVAKQ
jgi:hypothetical protein